MKCSILLVVSVLGMVAATPVHADLPSPANWSVPTHIQLVGTNGVVPAPVGQFEVVARDLANNPIPGADVVLDLSGVSDMHFCADQADPAFTVRCLQRTIGKHTDAQGRVTFVIAGGGNGPAVSAAGSARIFGDGVLVAGAGLTLSAFDVDGAGGVSGNDFSQWLDAFGGGYTQRGDFDGSGGLGGNDLSVLLQAYGSGDQAQSCATVCP